ncbi:hypothetical protein SAMN05421767_1741, partial [Granulicatella balaenopterae]
QEKALLKGDVIADAQTAGLTAIENPTGVTLTTDGIKVDGLTTAIIRLAKVDPQAEHDKKVAEAVKKVKALDDLTSDEQQKFIDELQATQIGDDLDAIVKKAEDLAAQKQAHAAKVAEAKKEIAAMEGLTDEEKSDFNTKLDATTVGTDLTPIITEAQNLSDQHIADQAQAEHDAKVAEAKKEIAAMEGLTDEEKSDFNTKLDNTKVGDNLDPIIEEAQNLSDQHIADQAQAEHDAKVAEAKKQIEAMPGLTDTEKADFNTKLDATTVGDNLDPIIDEAQNLSDQHIAEQKQAHAAKVAEAKKEIAAMEGLTDEEKSDFNTKLDATTVGTDLTPIITEAQNLSDQHIADQAQAEHDKKVVEAKKQIAAMEGLTDEEKSDFNTKLDNTKVGDNLDPIIDEAQNLSDQHIADQAQAEHDAKVAEAKKQIEAMPGLSDDEKSDFNTKLDATKVGDNLDQIIEEAQNLSDQHIADQAQAEHDAKVAEAKKQIEAMEGLTDEEKSDFNTKLDATTVGTDLTPIITEAQNLSDQHIADQAQAEHDAKVAEAKKQIEAMPGLSDTEKADFNTKLDNTKVGDNLDPIIEEAQNLSDQHIADQAQAEHDAKVAEAKKQIEAMEGLTDTEKADFNTKLDATKVGDNLDPIIDEAQNLSDQHIAEQKPSKQRGWIKENGNWFYYKEDGQKAIGWLPE